MKKNNKNTLIWIFGCSKKYIPNIIIMCVNACMSSFLTVALAFTSKSVLEIAEEIAKGASMAEFWLNAAILGILVLSQIVVAIFDVYIRALTAAKLTVSLRRRLFDAITKRKFANISKYHSGDLLNRITSDADVLQGNIVNIIPDTVSILSKIIGCISALIILEPKLAILVLSVGVFVPAFGRLLSKYYKNLHKETQKTEGETRSFMQECFENLSVIKTFKTKTTVFERLRKLLNYNYKLKMKRTRVSVFMNFGMYSLFTIGYYAVLIWGAAQIANPEIAFTYGMLTAFLQLISQVKAPLKNISGIIPQYYTCLASAERLIEIENLDVDKIPIDDAEIQEVYDKFKFISVENVSFGYGDEEILTNVSCRIERGSMTAILGDSGTGKSTLFKLLLSLYEPNSGKITLNDEIPVDASVRAVFSYVPQGNMIVSGSIRENIAMCNPKASEEQIISACKIAEIYDYIETLPDGLDTELLERGSGLSEGQLQRIAIARALVADTPVLLLDEATSALDKTTEAKVLRNIKELSDKTVISVTHRTSNLFLCDNIINLSEMMK